MNRKVLAITIVAMSLALVTGLLSATRHSAGAAAGLPLTFEGSLSPSGATFAVVPQVQGRFTQVSSFSEFKVALSNTGAAPTDVYELETTSEWPVMLYGPDGATPLKDTNNSGRLDTGIVPLGQVFTLTARVETPPGTRISDSNSVELNITSWVNPIDTETAVMQSAIPAAFVQTLYQRSSRAMSLLFAQPDGAWQQQETPDFWFGEPAFFFPELAVAETASGYAYVWSNLRPRQGGWMNELEYRLTDKSGGAVTSLANLTDHSSATRGTFDESPTIAVAPDGRIGVAWYRKIVRPDSAENYNIYLAILNATGELESDEISVTENLKWRGGSSPDPGAPAFSAPRIAATRDNRFFVSWESATEVEDIYYAIWNSDGISVTNTVNLTNNVPGTGYQSYDPVAVAVAADRIFVSWNQRRPINQGGDDTRYTVIDSSGSTVKQPGDLSDEDSTVDWANYDAVELSNGDIIAAWGVFECEGYGPFPRIRYAVVKAQNYNRTAPPKCLPPTVVAANGDAGVSLAADSQGLVIITWTDQDPTSRRNLYYALLNSNGTVATDPMIFYQNLPTDMLLSTGLQGYGSASRVFLDATIGTAPANTAALPGSVVDLTIRFRNLGSVDGTSATITLTLAPKLSYFGDSAPITPTLAGQDITWTFPELPAWADESFEVQVAISDAAKTKQSYPLTVKIAVNEPEADLANNGASATIIAAARETIYMPSLFK